MSAVYDVYAFPDDPRIATIMSLCARRGRTVFIRSLEDPKNVRFLYERGHSEVPQVFEDNGEELLHIGGYEDLVSYIEMVTRIDS